MNRAHPDAPAASCTMCGSTELKPAERLPRGCWRCLNCGAVFRTTVDAVFVTEQQLSLVQRLMGINASLELLLEVVHAGGKLTMVGSGPLSGPCSRGYSATLASHTGARHAAASAGTLPECLEELCTRWGKQ